MYRAATHQEAVALIRQELRPQDKTGALIYGYWMQTHGFRYRHYEPTNLFEGRFKGQEIIPDRPKPIGSKLGRELNRWQRRWRKWLSLRKAGSPGKRVA